MNKVLLILLWLLLIAAKGSAQSTWWKEWFQQNSTQQEYLAKQIAALRVYVEYAKKGYKIYNEGLTTIGKMKDGEFSLHNDFFLSLKGINPEVARYARVADIARLQIATVTSYNQSMKVLRRGGHLNAQETQYIIRVFGRLLEDCSRLVDELITLTTSNKVELEDDERIQRIDKLHEEMLDKYRFAESFGAEIRHLNQHRARDKRDIEFNKRINNN